MTTSRLRHLVLAITATFALASCAQGSDSDTAADGGATPTASESASESTSDPAAGSSAPVVELIADPAAAGKCAMPNPETLAGFDTAFEGTVTSLDDGTATLAVDQWYAGGDGASEVTVTTPGKALEELLMAVDFQADQTYLVSATDGRVTLCGFSGEKSPELEGLYQAAYAG